VETIPRDAATAAALCLATYTESALKWHGSAPVWQLAPEPVVWGHRQIDGVNWVVFRGTSNFREWLLDLRAIANPFDHGILGPVHPGFYAGMEAVWRVVHETIPQPRILAGHSLGAARATILTGLAVASGEPPLARYGFGEPRAGFRALKDLIGGVPTWSFRNKVGEKVDPVTAVPITLALERYKHPVPLIDVSAAPAGWTPVFKSIALHNPWLYQLAVSQ
jgi:hypothetical protein